MKNGINIFILLTVMLVFVTACSPGSSVQINTAGSDNKRSASVSVPIYAPGPNLALNTPDADDRVSSFLPAIWHGIISPVTLVMSFINPDVQMYEVHNNGSQYNLGFLIGVAIVFIIIGALIGSRR